MSNFISFIISFIALVVSAMSLGWNVKLEFYRRKARLEVSQRNHGYCNTEDDRTKISLLFRNLSHRPTAVFAVYIRESAGGIIRSIGEDEGINLPIRISPWDIQIISFRVELHEEKRMSDILVRDVDDNQIVVIRQPGKPWNKSTG